MKTETFTHKGIEYKIECKDLTVGSVFGEPDLHVKVISPQGEQLVSGSLGSVVAHHIQEELGETPEDFLIAAAKSELQRIR